MFWHSLAWLCLFVGLAPVVVFFMAVFKLVAGETGFLAGWLMIGLTLPSLGLALVFWGLGVVGRPFNKW